MKDKLHQIRESLAFTHAGTNPVPTAHRFRPKNLKEYGLLLGLFSMLANPDLSPMDMENIASDVAGNPALRELVSRW